MYLFDFLISYCSFFPTNFLVDFTFFFDSPICHRFGYTPDARLLTELDKRRCLLINRIEIAAGRTGETLGSSFERFDKNCFRLDRVV